MTLRQKIWQSPKIYLPKIPKKTIATDDSIAWILTELLENHLQAKSTTTTLPILTYSPPYSARSIYRWMASTATPLRSTKYFTAARMARKFPCLSFRRRKVPVHHVHAYYTVTVDSTSAYYPPLGNISSQLFFSIFLTIQLTFTAV